MKTLKIFFLMMMFTGLLVSCGGEDKGGETTTEPAPTEETATDPAPEAEPEAKPEEEDHSGHDHDHDDHSH